MHAFKTYKWRQTVKRTVPIQKFFHRLTLLLILNGTKTCHLILTKNQGEVCDLFVFIFHEYETCYKPGQSISEPTFNKNCLFRRSYILYNSQCMPRINGTVRKYYLPKERKKRKTNKNNSQHLLVNWLVQIRPISSYVKLSSESSS